MSNSESPSKPVLTLVAGPVNVPRSFWADADVRRPYLSRIGSISTLDHIRRPRSFSSMSLEKNFNIEHADRAFFAAMREEVSAMREAGAECAERAGQHDLAAIIRGKPLPEWSGS